MQTANVYFHTDAYHAALDRLESIARAFDPAAPVDLRSQLVEALGDLAHLAPRLSERERILVRSPDAGGMKRARAFARLLGESLPAQVDLGVMEKRRGGNGGQTATFAGEADGAAAVGLAGVDVAAVVGDGDGLVTVPAIGIDVGVTHEHHAWTGGVAIDAGTGARPAVEVESTVSVE